MVYDTKTRELKTDDGKLLKKISCPLHKNWHELTVLRGDDNSRQCESCQKIVRDIGGMTDEEAVAFFRDNPRACVYLGSRHGNIRHRENWSVNKPLEPKPCACREIQTARGEEAINEGVKNGFYPLVHRVKTPEKFYLPMEVYQHIETGEIRGVGNVGFGAFVSDWYPGNKPEWRLIIERFTYEVNPPQEPIAAYLIPKDLVIGETVHLPDLIENLVRSEFNGHPSRLTSAYAVWRGEDFNILWDEKKDMNILMG
jgi:hypothetical protein